MLLHAFTLSTRVGQRSSLQIDVSRLPNRSFTVLKAEDKDMAWLPPSENRYCTMCITYTLKLTDSLPHVFS